MVCQWLSKEESTALHPAWIVEAPQEIAWSGDSARSAWALPEAKEKLSHGEPTWFAGKGKVFAMLDDHHHGAAHVSVWLPQPFGAVAALVCEAYLSVATTKLRNLALAAAGSVRPQS